MAFALSDIDAPTEGEQWLLRAEELFTAEEFVPALSAANQAVLATSGSARVAALGVEAQEISVFVAKKIVTLNPSQPEATAVAIRDNGSFMDPRSRKDWWR